MKVYYEKEIRDNYQQLTCYLIKNRLSISTMESATAGLLASLITDTPGSSAIFKGAYVTYSNDAKIKCGVSEQTVTVYSVYSKETAKEMAVSCAKEFGADIGIGVTGMMGNIDPSNPSDSIPGHVFVGLSIKGKVKAFTFEIEKQPNRYMYKLATAKEIYDRLMEELLNVGSK